MNVPPHITVWLRTVTRLSLLACLATPLLARDGLGFSVSTHRFITERALHGKLPMRNMSGLPEDKLIEFWTWVGERMTHDEGKPDDLDGWRFLQRFPNQEAFTATSIRSFLGLNYSTAQRIAGLDTTEGLSGTAQLDAYLAGSTWPDLDGRNQDRLLLNRHGEPLHLKNGHLVPFDPMTLNMGELTGLSSQAHAHYQLVADHPSDDVDVLKKEPWNFVLAIGWPGPVVTYAGWMAQMHLDVSTTADYWGHVAMTSAAEPLQVAWMAAGMHYVEDAAGPLHTVQVGSYALFKRAKIAYWLEALKNCGGYCGEVTPFTKIGLGYLHNHHLMAEAWLEDQVENAVAKGPAHPAIVKAWEEMGQDDPELLAALGDRLKPYMGGPLKPAPWQDGRGLANILVETEAKLASRDGAALYEAALLAGAPKLTAIGTLLPDDGGWKPEYLGDLRDPQVQAAVDTMARIQAKSLRRAATAVRIYYDALETASVAAAGQRLRRACLDNLDAAEKRRDAYVVNPPADPVQVVKNPWFLAADVGGFVLLLALIRWAVAWLDRKKPA